MQNIRLCNNAYVVEQQNEANCHTSDLTEHFLCVVRTRSMYLLHIVQRPINVVTHCTVELLTLGLLFDILHPVTNMFTHLS